MKINNQASKNIDYYDIIQKMVTQDKVHHCHIFYSNEEVDIEKYVLFAINLLRNNKIKSFDSEVYSHDLYLINFNQTNKTAKKDELMEAFIQISDASSIEQKRIMVVKDIDKMTLNAMGSILKLIEEPINNTVIFMTSRNLKRIPKTLISRVALLKIPAIIDDLTTEKINKLSEDKVYIDSMTTVFKSYEKIKLFSMQITSEMMTEMVEILSLRHNKVKLAVFLMNNLQKNNSYNLIKALIFVLQQLIFKNSLFYKLNAKHYLKIDINIEKITKIIEILNKFNKKINEYANFYVHKQVLINEIMEIYV